MVDLEGCIFVDAGVRYGWSFDHGGAWVSIDEATLISVRDVEALRINLKESKGHWLYEQYLEHFKELDSAKVMKVIRTTSTQLLSPWEEKHV